jgi:hypothetical protein
MKPGLISESLISKVLAGGGGYLPGVDAFDLKGFEILLGLSSDAINEHIKANSIPFKQIGRNRWLTVADFWGAFQFSSSS